MKAITRYKPLVEVTFLTEKGELVTRPVSTNEIKDTMDGDVISVSTKRSLGNDTPTFSINLVRRKKWHRQLASNDLVYIKMSRPPEALATVMVGLIDDIRNKSVMSDNGKPQRITTVTGRGLGKTLVNFDIGIVHDGGEFSINVNDNYGWLDLAIGNLSGATPHQVMQNTVENLIKKEIKYVWSDTVTFENLVDYSNMQGREDLTLIETTSYVNYSGSLWEFMKNIAEAPFHELYWEVNNDKVCLIMRPTPFNKPQWKGLREFEVTDIDVVAENTGRSDVETYSLYSVGCKTMYVGNDVYRTLGIKPLWNEEFSYKYGVRRLHTETSYMNLTANPNTDESEGIENTEGADNSGTTREPDTGTEGEGSNADTSTGSEAGDTLRGMALDLYDWNIKNNSMYNGTLIVRGSNTYKVGCKLKYTSTEDGSTITYYIKSVNHNFVCYGNWVTELEVIRGLDEADRFTAPVGQATEYEGTNYSEWVDSSTQFGDGTDGSYLGTDSEIAQRVVDGAYEWMNKGTVKYSFGADNMEGGKADCSSFTKYIYKRYADIAISRTSDGQAKEGTLVSKENALPGDLVIFQNTYRVGPSHVGILVEDGNFIHNSSSKSITKNSLTDSYWVTHFHSIRRVIEGNYSDVDYSGEYGITKKLLTNSNCFTKKTTKNTWIVIHNTAGGSSASGIYSWFNSGAGGANTSVHYAIGDEGILQMLEDNWKGGHTGAPPSGPGTWFDNYQKSKKAGGQGCGNSNSIGIEICDGGGKDKFRPRVENAIELTRYLMNKHGIPLSRVVRHLDVSGKPCPGYMIGKSFSGNQDVYFPWENFISEIQTRNAVKAPIKVGSAPVGGGGGSSTSQGSSKDAQKLNKNFKNKLSGTGDKFVKYANQYKIDVYIAAAIAIQETGNGTSSAIKNKNNVGGMYNSKKGELFSFKSLDEGIQAHCRNLKNNYWNCGLTTLKTIQPKYCPIGASNDPTGLNKHWLPNTTKFYNQLKGS